MRLAASRDERALDRDKVAGLVVFEQGRIVQNNTAAVGGGLAVRAVVYDLQIPERRLSLIDDYRAAQ